jgi:CHAT domain-containing protein
MWRGRPLIVSAVVVVLCAATVASWAIWRRPDKEVDGLAALWRTVGGERRVEGRLSGGQPYGRYGPIDRERSAIEVSASPGESAEFHRVAAALASRAAERPSDETAHASGTLALLRGESGAAVDRLALVAQRGGLAEQLSDLAAAYLERARVTGEAEDLIRALEVAERAARIDPSLPEARFNVALALEKVSLVAQAREAWNEYLRRDTTSGWGGEAARRLAALRCEVTAPKGPGEGLAEALSQLDPADVRATVEGSPHAARMAAWESLLPSWAEAKARGDALHAARALAAVRAIGSSLRDERGDAWIAATVGAIDASDGPRQREIATAVAKLAAARAEATVDVATASDSFHVAAERFGQLGIPSGEADALLGFAICRQWQLRFADAERALDRVAEIAVRERYPYLACRAAWICALVAGGSGHLSETIRAVRVALHYATLAGHAEGIAYLHLIAAETFGMLGEPRMMAASAVAALREASSLPRSRQTAFIAAGVSEELARAGFLLAALRVQSAALEAAQAEGDDRTEAYIGVVLGATYRRLGDTERAGATLDNAQRHIDLIGDPAVAARLRADLLLARAELDVGKDPERAATMCSEALALFESTEDRVRWTRAHLLRAEALTVLGRVDAAGEDLARTVDEVERVRASVSDPSLRLAISRDAHRTYDAMIAFQLGPHGDTAAAFNVAERSRCRTLLDLVERDMGEESVDPLDDDVVLGRATRPLALAEIQARLPENVVLVEYAVLEDRLVAWLIGRGGVFRQSVVAIDEGELAQLAERLRSVLERRDNEGLVRECAGRLYELLVTPIERDLPPGSTIVIVPDKALWSVAFPALAAPRSNVYLIERYTVAVAPSASVFLAALRRDEELLAERSSVACVVGNPAFDRSRFAALGPLEAAEGEARSIASLYAGARLLVGPDATASRFVEAAADADVIHFAGHSLDRSGGLAEPALIFAPDLSGRGELTASTLQRTRLARARLVVLSACRSGHGRSDGREGVNSLARAVLAANCPAVVASLTEVDDRATARLFTEFHTRVASGKSPIVALREAQRRMLDDPDPSMRHASSWASFELVGGAFVRDERKGERP